MASVVDFEHSRSGRGAHLATRSRSPAAPPNHRSLALVIESQVLPRLMLAHGVCPRLEPSHDRPSAIQPGEVEAFAPLTLRIDALALLGQVERMLARGVTIDTLFVDLLAPTARTLGQWWEEDRCDFIEVTMGLWRLQEVVRELSVRTAPPAGGIGSPPPRSALFAAVPGDQHDFGALLIGELFRGHGWDSEIAIGADTSELLALVRHRHFDIVGLTASCDSHSERLTSIILALRSVSRNPQLRVMVGGRVFVENPALAQHVGADATAPDAQQALFVAGGMVDALIRDAVACG